MRELPGRRTATSNTFLLADGSLEARVYETSVNYLADDGTWQPIDESLRETTNGAFANGESSVDVHLPEDLEEGAIKVSTGDQWVSERPLGIETEPGDIAAENVASYAAESGLASFQFSGLPNGLKEAIELADSSAPATYHFLLEASAGVVAELTEKGSIEFRDEEGELVAEMPSPFMVDAADVTAPLGAVRYSLEEAGPQSWRLAVEADPQWLQAPERSWPVIIDPSVTIPAPSRDCIIATTTENQMCGTAGYGYLTAKANYPSVGADQFARTLLYFNLQPSLGKPLIPKDASLTSATIGLHSAKTATNVTKVDLYDVNRSWSNAATWKYHSGPLLGKWTTAGGDFGKAMASPASVTTAKRGSQPGPWEFSSPSLTWLVQRWNSQPLSKDYLANNGVLLKLADETPRVCCIERRVEWESSAGANKPYLSVQYILPASADSKITSPTDGTKTAKRFVLGAEWDHSGVDGITFQYKGAQGWTDIPESEVIDGNNQTVKWPDFVKAEDRESRPLYWDASGVAAGKASAKVQIRAVLSGSPGAGGYTKPVEAEVNKDTGGPKDATTGIGPGAVDLLTGNFTVSRTDVSIPAFGAALEFSRSHSSRQAEVGATGVLGPGWKPASPVEEAGGSAWTKLKIEEEVEEFEGESFTYKWATLTHADGGEIAFEVGPSGEFITPPEMSGYVLHRLSETEIAFTDPDGIRTVFSNHGSGSEYVPISVAQTGGPGNKTRMIYEIVNGNRRLKQVIAPTPQGVTCPDEEATTTPGCRVLTFTYNVPPVGGSFVRLQKITYHAPGNGGPWEVANYSYDAQGRLTAAWDPRLPVGLKETYAYTAKGQVMTLTPGAQLPWTMEYEQIAGDGTPGRLRAVSRGTLVESHPVARTTIAYNVPVSGSGAPYGMGGEAVAAWGQEDLPTDATAIFPPDEEPANPPSSYARATVHYMDAEGQNVNVATPSGAGTSAPSITTTETDEFGNVVRELGAQNRLRALAAGAEQSATRSRELDTQFRYSKDGTELQEEKGPMRQVRLGSGTTTQARLHRSIQYDQGAPTPGAGEPMPHLPTSETTGALLANGSIVDKRSTENRYNWSLRKQTETIVDPGGSEETKLVTVYDAVSGLPTEYRQPKNAGGGGAGTTKIVYYKGSLISNPAECLSSTFAGLPCWIEPAAQPGTEGQPQLLVKKLPSYNQLGQPLEIVESPGGGAENVRKTIFTYDTAGRQKTKEIIGGGVPVPKVETLYSSTLGMPTTQRFVCPESEPGCDTQATTATYDALGRVTDYEDADSVTAETTYDFLGRPAVVSDGKGTQTLKYDSVTGLLVELEDSAAGTFTASYNADGSLAKRSLPNGLTAETTYDETGAPAGLSYTKASNCGLSCNWLSFDVERSIDGQILLEDGTLGKDEYAYDKLGRLITARETPAGGTCTTRSYKYDKDSNREEMTTSQGIGGTCSESGGMTQKYSYDSADRLLGEGLAYDSFGRITNLPAEFAGGKALATTFFSTDMVATQSQNGVTNSFQLDAMLRQRQRLQAGGLEGVEVFHYAGPGDSPTWTQRGSVWSRSISGIGGELAATQESGKEVELQLTNLHGDVVAAAALNPTVSELKATFRHDEFGVPVSGEAGRFGWLGGKQRRTELPSGVIQMGARSYVPSLGRFLTPDPILRGSDNPYDYANQDPINNLDLAGTACTKDKGSKKDCRRAQRSGERRVRSVIANLRERLRKAREKRASGWVLGVEGVHIPKLPWEKDATEAINMGTGILKALDKATSCDAGQAIAGAGSAWYTLKAAEFAKSVAPAATKLAARFGFVGAALGVADVLGFC